MDYYISDIDINHIDTEFTPFSISYAFDLSNIIRSIQKVGMINRAVVKKGKDRFIIVAGHKRIWAIKKLGWKRVGVNIIEQKISDLECLLINLYDNISIREFNHVEKAIILSKLANHLSVDEIMREFMPLLGLPSHKTILDMYLWIERDLENELKMLLAQERVSIKSIRIFFEWEIPKEDIKVYTHIFNKLKLSFNKQIQLIEYTYDICREKNMSLIHFLKDSAMWDIIEDTTLNTKDKTRKIIEILKRKRFPSLYRAEQIFYERIKKIKKMNIPDGVSIDAPAYFEHPLYRMTISFKNGYELMDKIANLININDLKEIKDPWQEK